MTLETLRPQINEVYEKAQSYAKRTDLPQSHEAFVSELDELEAITDQSLEFQKKLLAIDRSIFDAEISSLHDRIYEISQLIKPRLLELNAFADKLTAKNTQRVAVEKFIAEKRERLRELNAREEELLKEGYAVNAKELADILGEKELINHELERWIN